MSDQKGKDRNKRPILLAAGLAVLYGGFTLISGWLSPVLQQFCQASCPWVLMGLGIAGFLASQTDQAET